MSAIFVLAYVMQAERNISIENNSFFMLIVVFWSCNITKNRYKDKRIFDKTLLVITESDVSLIEPKSNNTFIFRCLLFVIHYFSVLLH